MNNHSKTGYIAGLDLVRFGAAAFVVFYHLGFWIWAGDGPSVSYRWPSSIAWFGSVGVEIFFSLSGFVIAYTAVNSTWSSFARSRLSRLIPGSLICATLTLLLCLSFHSETPQKLVGEWLRSAVLPIRGPFIDSSYWTLPIEFIFYSLVFALIVLRREKLLPRTIGIVGLLSSTMWFVLTIARIAAPTHLWNSSKTAAELIYLVSERQAWLFTLLPHGCFFAIGVLLWFCLTHNTSFSRLIVLVICIVGGLCETYWHAQITLDRVSLTHPEAVGCTWNAFIPCGIWIFAIIILITSVRRNKTISLILNPYLPVIRWAGLLTYPLYLLHQRAGYVLIQKLHGRVNDNFSLLLVTFFMFAAALCIARFVEPPLRHRIQKIMGAQC